MERLSISTRRTKGNNASRTSAGSAVFTLFAKLGLEHFDSREPTLFTSPRVVLISCVRAATKASRNPQYHQVLPHLCTPVLNRTQGLWIHSTQPRSLCASIRSFLR